MLKRIFDPATIYERRAQRCLEDARMAALEHETAAEHHAALAKMYRERVVRIGRELSGAHEPNLVLDSSTRARVTAMRRGDGAGTPPYLAQGGTAAS